jgi:hypothetical protein
MRLRHMLLYDWSIFCDRLKVSCLKSCFLMSFNALNTNINIIHIGSSSSYRAVNTLRLDYSKINNVSRDVEQRLRKPSLLSKYHESSQRTCKWNFINTKSTAFTGQNFTKFTNSQSHCGSISYIGFHPNPTIGGTYGYNFIHTPK